MNEKYFALNYSHENLSVKCKNEKKRKEKFTRKYENINVKNILMNG